jgi:transposase InsO family protein
MPWEVLPVSELRLAFVHQVLTLHRPVPQTCAEFHISRKTGYKWLQRYHAQQADGLADRSRRPQHSPRRIAADLEAAILRVRDTYGWGPRKIHAYLKNQNVHHCCTRTVANVLGRHGRIAAPARVEPAAVQFFERSAPNELWQCDFKGPLEVERRTVYPFTVVDDHSRYLLALRPELDKTMGTAFAALWGAFGEFGLPERILCDNAFGSPQPEVPGVSWFEARLIRLGIDTSHGRPYHPQTQGKVERLHGTLEDEVWPYVRRDRIEHFNEDMNRWRREVYNAIRPHEALGDQPPLSRFRPSPRRRPQRLPAVEYPPGSELRRVRGSGHILWRGCTVRVGSGLIDEWVRIEDRGHEVVIYYDWKQIRSLPVAGLVPGRSL